MHLNTHMILYTKYTHIYIYICIYVYIIYMRIYVNMLHSTPRSKHGMSSSRVPRPHESPPWESPQQPLAARVRSPPLRSSLPRRSRSHCNPHRRSRCWEPGARPSGPPALRWVSLAGLAGSQKLGTPMFINVYVHFP